MKIIIGHLFHDLLNLYGENGNVLALQKAFQTQGIEVETRYLSIDNEPWDLDDIDIIYIGSGTEQNQLLALNTLIKYKDDINQKIMSNKFILSTGNSIELFGKLIKQDAEQVNTLAIFDYTCERTKKRIVSECVFNYDEIDAKILGFENHQGIICGIAEPLFTVAKGFSSDLKSNHEGFRQNNFFGTYLLGPVLARNPKLLEKLCKEVILTKDINFEFKPFNFEIEKLAHNKFLNKYNID